MPTACVDTHALDRRVGRTEVPEVLITAWETTRRIRMGDVSLELPSALTVGGSVPVDSGAVVFEGEGLTVIVDQGPFADPLTSYSGRPQLREEAIRLCETDARLISFRTPEDGSYSVATHVPRRSPVTVFVQAAESVPRRVSLAIVESLQSVG